jgi:hypothetical protein
LSILGFDNPHPKDGGKRTCDHKVGAVAVEVDTKSRPMLGNELDIVAFDRPLPNRMIDLVADRAARCVRVLDLPDLSA